MNMFANQQQGGFAPQNQQQPQQQQSMGGGGQMNFAGQAGAGNDMDNALLPDNQMAFVRVNYRKLHTNTNTGTRSLDLEFTICEDQPYAGRKIWMYMADPFWEGNSEDYAEMGKVHIARMLEVGRGAGPQNMVGYDIGGWPDGFQNLDGLVVAVRLGIEKGTKGYSDKTKVVEFLSNNTDSASFKMFQALSQGNYNWNEYKKAQKEQAQGGAVQSQQQQQGFTQGQSQPQQQQGQQQFPTNQQAQPATPAANQPPATGQAPNQPATNAATFPSNQQGQPRQQEQGFNPNQAPAFIQNSNQ